MFGLCVSVEDVMAVFGVWEAHLANGPQQVKLVNDDQRVVRTPEGSELHTAEFYFEVKYKLWKTNQQADTLYMLHTEAEMATNDDEHDIPTFLFDNTVDTTSTDFIEPDFTDLNYLFLDKFYATKEVSNANDTALSQST